MEDDSATQALNYIWVATPEAFQGMLEALITAPRIALDIEADSLYHYFEKVCLIQISSDSQTYILDPLAVRDLGPLSAIMRDPAVEKVFHAASYDISCLRRDYGFSFTNLFDTHISAQLLGYEQLGLDALLERVLGITHSKRRQRDDWSHRPLAPQQLEYAAMDTHHLLRLRDLLEGLLRRKGRWSWAQEEFSALAELEPSDRVFDPEGFHRIKGSRKLASTQRAVLRALYLLRDRYAREMDVPPFKVMNNSVLLDLARNPPHLPGDLFNRPGISFRVARKYAGEIHRIMESARSDVTSSLVQPARISSKSPSGETKARLDLLRSWRRAQAEEFGLHVGVLFPGTLLEILAAFPPADLDALERVPGIRRWRVREFGERILHILNSGE